MYSFTQQQAMESFVSAKIDQAAQKLRDEIRNLVSSSSNPTSSIRSETSNSTRQESNSGQSSNGGSLITPPSSPIFNYIIEGPNENDPKSAITAEINLDSPNLYVLGLQNQELKWVTGGEGSIQPHPWQITKKTENNVVYFKVNPDSFVFAGVGTFSEISVSGLDTWEVGEEGYVVLSGTVADNQLTELEVVWGVSGDDLRAEYNGQNSQTILRARLGLIYEDEDEILRIRQYAFSNFTAITSCYDGKPTICLVQT